MSKGIGSVFDERWRAFWLPVLGVVAIFCLVFWGKDVDQASISAGIAAIATLVGSAAGHAAGSAKAVNSSFRREVSGGKDNAPNAEGNYASEQQPRPESAV
jgi:hypothetical protein